jgi:outer membrane protein OmpA-like peptidoglycan-associated protein
VRGSFVLALALLLGATLGASDLVAQKIRLDERGAHGISLAYHQGSYFMAWAGLSNRIYVMRSDDGIDWVAKVALDERSSHAPDIASDGDRLYLIWVGEDSEYLYVMSSRDGIDWSNKARLDERSNARPAITARDGGPLLIAWKGQTSNKLNVMRSRDGVDWGAKVTIDEGTLNGLTLAAYDGDFYIAWTGLSNNDLYVMRSEEGIDWRSKVRLNERARKAPSLASFDGRLYLAWPGDSRGDIYVMESTDGVDWRAKQRLDERTLKSLKLTGGHKLALSFQGDSSDNLYFLMIRERREVAGAIEGQVIDAETDRPLAGARVSSDIGETITDRDGGFAISDVPAGAISVRASLPGYEGDGMIVDVVAGRIVEITLALAPIVEERSVIEQELEEKGRATLRGIYFDFDSATLRPESDETLSLVLSILQDNPDAEFIFEGHTSSEGSDDYNRILSQKRAEAVVTWLVNRNVAARRLAAQGFGESRPVADNDTEEGRSLNRRVEIVQK